MRVSWYHLKGERMMHGGDTPIMGPFAERKHNIFQNELLRSIAGKYQKTVAQVILRWLAQREVVAIPKSVRKERIEENFTIFDFDLSSDDMAGIGMLDTKTSSFFDHSDPAVGKWLGEARRPTENDNRLDYQPKEKHDAEENTRKKWP